MNTSAPPTPIHKTVVLVGAGNAHLVFVRRWRMRSLPGVAVALVNEAPTVPYSAMVPAHVSGDYRRDEITIDLVRLCRSAGVRLIDERVAALNPVSRSVLFADRPPLTYDVLSLGLGSVPADLTRPAAPDFALTLRPLAALIHQLERIDAELTANPRPFHFAVVGGGASGCELSLAIHNRLGRHPGFRITLLQSRDRLLPRFPSRTGRAFGEAFRARGIAWRANARVTGGTPGELALANGEKVMCDAVLWATPGSPPVLIRESGLATDEGGFLRVRETLQSETDPAVFGTGDCASFTAYPGLARSGVYAVRQGAVLYDNVTAILRDRPPRPFRPQRRCLYLLNTGDGSAVLNYGPLAWKARWVRRMKDWIDRKWVASFLPSEMKTGATQGEDENTLMRGVGCRIPPDSSV